MRQQCSHEHARIYDSTPWLSLDSLSSKPCHEVLKFDIRETEAQGQILQQLEVHNMQHSQMAPPCGTFSRVREVNVGNECNTIVHMRSNVLGISNTTPEAGAKVHRDNQLVVFTARVCGWCCARNIKGRGGKPAQRLAMGVAELPHGNNVFSVLCQQCMLGEERDLCHERRFFFWGGGGGGVNL